MAKTTETIGEFTMNILTAEQYADAKKNNQIDPNQLYFTPEKKLVVAVSQDEYEAMKEAGTLDEDVLYVTPASESVTIPEATETTAGLMSSTQYSKLSGIESGANKTTVDAALSSSSANPVQNKIVYAALPWEYSATFYVDSWSTATSDEQAQGFAYRQVVTPVKKISVAPTITANSMFLGFGSPSDSSVLTTKVALTEAANVINGGLVYTGSNSITVLVEEKPTSDVTMTWWLRT